MYMQLKPNIYYLTMHIEHMHMKTGDTEKHGHLSVSEADMLGL